MIKKISVYIFCLVFAGAVTATNPESPEKWQANWVHFGHKNTILKQAGPVAVRLVKDPGKNNTLLRLINPDYLQAGQTFIGLPLSKEHKIDRLTRSVTRDLLDRELFSVADRTASFYQIDYLKRAPFVSSTFVQFVTDPGWNRIIYGNLNNWIRSYDEVEGPVAIHVDPLGRVYIAEQRGRRVSVLKISGKGNDAELVPLYRIENIENPVDLAVNYGATPFDAEDDYLYVADASENQILKFKLATDHATLERRYKGFDTPALVRMGKWDGVCSGEIYVVDKLSSRIRVFEENGSGLELKQTLSGNNRNYYTSLKTDHFGNIYLVDRVNSKILKYSASLEYLDETGEEEYFTSLHEIDIPFGRIYIEGEDTYWAGFDQVFALEGWSDESGAQRKQLGVSLKDIQFKTDNSFSRIAADFILTDVAELTFAVSDASGRNISRVNAGWMPSGANAVQWERRDNQGRFITPGNYTLSLEARSPYNDERTTTEHEIYIPLYYWQDAGSENALDDEFLVRGQSVRWGEEAHLTANRDDERVEYRIGGLDSQAAYQIDVEYYSGDGVPRRQNLTAGQFEIHGEISIAASSRERLNALELPAGSYDEGYVLLSINRLGEGSAVISQLWIREKAADFTPRQEAGLVPQFHTLDQNYPNPFNPSTTIAYQLPQAEQVLIRIFDVLGREVATVVDGYRDQGLHEVQFDAGKFASGIYIYQIQAGVFTESRKMLLVK